MFIRKQKIYDVSAPEVSTNRYNEEIKTYSSIGQVRIAIAINSHMNYQGNDQDILNADFVGLTTNKLMKKGFLIDNRLEITFIDKTNRRYDIVYLKEVDNCGEF